MNVNIKKKSFIFLFTSILLIFSLLFTDTTALGALPPEAKDNNLDPDLKMITGEQYKDGKGERYSISRHPDNTMNRNDYAHDMNWYVDTQGYMYISPLKRSRKGIMALLRPEYPNGHLGRLFIYPSQYEIENWADNFNGNADYVYRTVGKTTIEERSTGKTFQRVYIRDLAKLAGATITLEGTGQFDTGYGNQLTTAVVTTTRYPAGTITAPSTASVGSSVNIGISGEEFYPSSAYDTREFVKWELSVGSQVIESSSRSSKTFTSQKSHTFTADGTYTITLKVTDQVERTYTTTKQIVVGTGQCQDPNGCGGNGGGGDDGGNEPPPPPPNPCNGGGCDEVVLTCPQPDRPSDLDKPFQYKIDLVTERIEGKTVEKGTYTLTPVTVYRADFSAERQAIKDRLNQSIVKNETFKSQCQSNINTMQSNLSSLQSKLSSIQSSLSACQSSDADCSNISAGLSQVQGAISRQQAAISAAQAMLPRYDQVIREIRAYIQTILDAEAKFRIINTNVDLTFRDKKSDKVDFIERKPVALEENERKLLNYTWILNADGFVKAFIDPDNEYPLCPSPDPKNVPCETDEDNNIKETPIYIATFETVQSCAREGEKSELKGIVRTVTTGSGTQIYEELVDASLFINPDEKVRRAGYGFYYKVDTNYTNEDLDRNRNKLGVLTVSPYKPAKLANYLPYQFESWEAPYSFSTQVKQSDLSFSGYKVPSMVTTDFQERDQTNQPYQISKLWELPKYSVEAYSGNVFEGDNTVASFHPMHNPHDELLDGGRKWYLDFKQPDGTYAYNILIPEIGVNKLNLCVSGEVEVIGSFIGDPNGNDDFVFRPIDPTNPFPAGTGWNWQGYESKIAAIQEWWRNWNYPNPKDVPPNYHEDHYILPRSLIKEIRKYSEKQGGPNEIELGDNFMGQHGFK